MNIKELDVEVLKLGTAMFRLEAQILISLDKEIKAIQDDMERKSDLFRGQYYDRLGFHKGAEAACRYIRGRLMHPVMRAIYQNAAEMEEECARRIGELERSESSQDDITIGLERETLQSQES